MRKDHPVVRPAMGRGLIHRGTRGASGAACSDDEQCGNTSLSKTLLPPTAADLRHLLDRAIPRARPWSPSRHTCRFVWGHHDGRAPCRGRIVERDCVVDRDAGAVGVERRDQASAGCRVIYRRLRPRVGHDILRGGSALSARHAHCVSVHRARSRVPARRTARGDPTSPVATAEHVLSPFLRRGTFPLPVAPTRANVDGRRLPAAATPRRNRVHDPARDRLDHHPR